ncbi:hypothetical protein D3C73_730620 [compost metagenome]
MRKNPYLLRMIRKRTIKKGQKKANVQSVNLNISSITVPHSGIYSFSAANEHLNRSDFLVNVDWPRNPMQDVGWNHVLKKQDAAFGYFRDPAIQIGKTSRSQVLKSQGEPVNIAELDGLTFYEYNGYSLGFEGSKDEVNSDTLLNEIQWHLPSITGYYYSPERIISALGQPNHIYYYDESYAYVMYYKTGSYAFGLVSDDEGELLEQAILFPADEDFFDP